METLILLLVYFLPSIFAHYKKVNTASWEKICIINFLTGWTILGWFYAFYLTAKMKESENFWSKKEGCNLFKKFHPNMPLYIWADSGLMSGNKAGKWSAEVESLTPKYIDFKQYESEINSLKALLILVENELGSFWFDDYTYDESPIITQTAISNAVDNNYITEKQIRNSIYLFKQQYSSLDVESMSIDEIYLDFCINNFEDIPYEKSAF